MPFTFWCPDMAAVLTPTRRSLYRRLRASVRCVYLRWLLKHAEGDLAHERAELQRALDHWPSQIDRTNAYVDALTRRLTRANHDL